MYYKRYWTVNNRIIWATSLHIIIINDSAEIENEYLFIGIIEAEIDKPTFLSYIHFKLMKLFLFCS